MKIVTKDNHVIFAPLGNLGFCLVAEKSKHNGLISVRLCLSGEEIVNCDNRPYLAGNNYGVFLENDNGDYLGELKFFDNGLIIYNEEEMHVVWVQFQ